MALVLAGCASSSALSSPDTAAEIVQSQCTRCHGVERIQAAQYDKAGWAATVTRMRNTHGAQLTDAQAAAVIDFLAGGGASQLR